MASRSSNRNWFYLSRLILDLAHRFDEHFDLCTHQSQILLERYPLL